jgi:hypothetical protein
MAALEVRAPKSAKKAPAPPVSIDAEHTEAATRGSDATATTAE